MTLMANLPDVLSREGEEFHNGCPWPDLTALGRQEEGEEPKGRADPLGPQVGGPGLRFPDEYDG